MCQFKIAASIVSGEYHAYRNPELDGHGLHIFFPPTYSSTLMFALLIYKLKTKRERGEPPNAVFGGFHIL